jgi:hypothetical protein
MPKKQAACLVLGSLCFLYLQTFLLPCVPIYQGDNAPFFLLDAARMWRGEVIYRDFLELAFPGLPALDFLLFRVFGMRAWIPSATLVFVGLALTQLSAHIARRVVSGPSIFLPSVAYLTLAIGNALDDTHHWFSILACMGALAVLLEDRRPVRVVLAGALCGIATCFTQSRGVSAVSALTAFLLWEGHAQRLGHRWWMKRLLGLLASCGVVIILVLAGFAWRAGWASFSNCTFGFVAKYYSFFHRNNLSVFMVDMPVFGSLLLSIPALAVWLFINLLAPLVYLLFMVQWWRNRERNPQPLSGRLLLINLMGLAFFVSIASAPNWIRVASSALPGLILLAWFLDAPGKLKRMARWTLWGVSLGTGIVTPMITQLSAQGPLQTPTGRVAVVDTDRYEKYRWLLPHTSSNQYVVDAGSGDAYFLLNLQDLAPVPFLTLSAYTRPEQVSALLNTLGRQKARYIIWPVELDLPPFGNRGSDPLGPLRAYMRKNYFVVSTFSDGAQVWQRKQQTPA